MSVRVTGFRSPAAEVSHRDSNGQVPGRDWERGDDTRNLHSEQEAARCSNRTQSDRPTASGCGIRSRRGDALLRVVLRGLGEAEFLELDGFER